MDSSRLLESVATVPVVTVKVLKFARVPDMSELDRVPMAAVVPVNVAAVSCVVVIVLACTLVTEDVWVPSRTKLCAVRVPCNTEFPFPKT